jgi:hypothetical protein
MANLQLMAAVAYKWQQLRTHGNICLQMAAVASRWQIDAAEEGVLCPFKQGCYYSALTQLAKSFPLVEVLLAAYVGLGLRDLHAGHPVLCHPLGVAM